jgi:hypothetical protein
LAVRLGHQGDVRVAWRGQIQRALQGDLPGRAVEQVGAAHHVRDALQGIINDHRELIGEAPVAAPDDYVAALG